ncbi:MAG: VWA domain-containing protein, partial [Anaerolineae bacterium]|nr:VWA domain-containing protein [Anaerolineae bacterium]
MHRSALTRAFQALVITMLILSLIAPIVQQRARVRLPIAAPRPALASDSARPAAQPVQQGGARRVDIVFLVDTSGSMDEEYNTLCDVIDRLVSDLQARGITVRYKVYGISQTRACATEYVAGRFSGGITRYEEDWGPAVRDVAIAYGWQPGYTRLVVPMSDEGPYDGSPCYDPGDDADSITEAILASNRNNVRAAPIIGNVSSGDDLQCIQVLAERLANGTGGVVSNLYDDPATLAARLMALIQTVAADRDGDGIADTEDPAPDDPCKPNPQVVCLPPQVCGISNTPRWDDDKDGRADEETMNNRDDDGDGLIDEDVGGIDCPYPAQDCGLNSHRGFDDDGDRQTDEEADDGRDNDG